MLPDASFRRAVWLPTLFRPAAGLAGPHVQTIVANLLRRGRDLSFRRERVETPDGDFIDLDWPVLPGRDGAPLPAEAPLVLHLHGLEGSARRGYAAESYRQLARRGVRSVGMNFRSCSGEINRTARFYHAGATEDVRTVVAHLLASRPGRPLGLVGFSLGGNILLKLLGEWGAAAPAELTAAAVISPPFDLLLNSRRLLRPPGLWYGRRFLPSLKNKVRAKRPLLEAAGLDVEKVLGVRNLVEFDEWATAPLHGFAGADDYYRRVSSTAFLGEIYRPVLIIRAQDDPMMDSADIPYAAVSDSPYLTGLFPSRGGHVGFASGRWGKSIRFWAETEAASFLDHHFTTAGLV